MIAGSKDVGRPLVADGAVGMRLAALHADRSAPPEALNLSHGDLVRAVHQEYLAAGAELHRTNTRYANAVALAAYGLAERCESVNNSASALVREGVGHDLPVMGAIGQILPGADGTLAPLATRERAYSEQVVYLSDTGATFLGLEHFSSLEEALLVLRIAQSASDAPLLAQLQLDDRGHTAEGLGCEEAAQRLIDGGAEALGLSCGPAPERLPSLVETLLLRGLPVSVMLGMRPPEPSPHNPANARISPEAFAGTLAGLAEMGVAIVGGCCGAAPLHIAALAKRFGGAGGVVREKDEPAT